MIWKFCPDVFLLLFLPGWSLRCRFQGYHSHSRPLDRQRLSVRTGRKHPTQKWLQRLVSFFIWFFLQKFTLETILGGASFLDKLLVYFIHLDDSLLGLTFWPLGGVLSEETQTVASCRRKSTLASAVSPSWTDAAQRSRWHAVFTSTCLCACQELKNRHSVAHKGSRFVQDTQTHAM